MRSAAAVVLRAAVGGHQHAVTDQQARMHDRLRVDVLWPALPSFFGHVFVTHDHFNFGIQLLHVEVNRLLTVTAENR